MLTPVLWKKAPQSNESYERETVPFQPYFGCTKSFLKVLSKLALPSNESYESKTGCNRTLATVLWAPLSLKRFLGTGIANGWRHKPPSLALHMHKDV